MYFYSDFGENTPKILAHTVTVLHNWEFMYRLLLDAA